MTEAQKEGRTDGRKDGRKEGNRFLYMARSPVMPSIKRLSSMSPTTIGKEGRKGKRRKEGRKER